MTLACNSAFRVQHSAFKCDDIANELVKWFNDVDATYKADLHELNELNFARFDSKMEARLARIDTKLAELKSELVPWMFMFWATTALGLIAILLRR